MIKSFFLFLLLLLLLGCDVADDNSIVFTWDKVSDDVTYKILFGPHSRGDIKDPNQFKYPFAFNAEKNTMYKYPNFLEFYYGQEILYVSVIAIDQSDNISYFSNEVEVPITVFEKINTPGVEVNLN